MRRGENCYALLNDNKVPFAKMWSSALVSKPADWGPHRYCCYYTSDISVAAVAIAAAFSVTHVRSATAVIV
eukprot:16981-Heterococcus_DN1.PRE.3